MQNALDNKLLLRAFQVIREHGQQDDQGRYRLDGYWAESDADGYNITLGDGDVSVTIGFHHSYHCDGTEHEIETFTQRLKKMLDSRKTR